MNCPSCGQSATGKFCSNCGSALAGSTCGSCGAALSARAKFCHACGAASSDGGARRPNVVPWIAAGAAVVVVIAVLAVTQLDTGSRPQGIPASPPISGGGGVPDISRMGPRELADRAFNRTMSAEELAKERVASQKSLKAKK